MKQELIERYNDHYCVAPRIAWGLIKKLEFHYRQTDPSAECCWTYLTLPTSFENFGSPFRTRCRNEIGRQLEQVRAGQPEPRNVMQEIILAELLAEMSLEYRNHSATDGWPDHENDINPEWLEEELFQDEDFKWLFSATNPVPMSEDELFEDFLNVDGGGVP